MSDRRERAEGTASDRCADVAIEQALVLVDYKAAAGEPDGGVDMTYSYTGLIGDWPLETRWEGAVTIEDYSIAGEVGPSGLGLVTPRGLVQFIGGSHPDVFRSARQAQLPRGRGSLSSESGIVGLSGMTTGVAQSGSGPVRVGGNIRAPVKTVDVPPVPSEQATRAGIKGVVILEIREGERDEDDIAASLARRRLHRQGCSRAAESPWSETLSTAPLFMLSPAAQFRRGRSGAPPRPAPTA